MGTNEKSAVSCPACHSRHWVEMQCGEAVQAPNGSPCAMCCECATAWELSSGRVLEGSAGGCAYAARRRHPLSDEERRRFADQFAAFFSRIGMVLDQPGTVDTPLRFVDTMADLTAGYDGDPRIDVVFPKECREACGHDQIVEANIPFFALCEHHVLPFYGHATVGYLRNDLIIGVSKLTRIVRLAAKRFTQQERMGRDIADLLEAVVHPTGVAVIIRGHHMCSQMRGVRDVVSQMRTIVWRGAYQQNEALQRVFFELAGHQTGS
jgi:GTP cyclohydrolase IA